MMEDWFYKRNNRLVFFKVIYAQLERLVAAALV